MDIACFHIGILSHKAGDEETGSIIAVLDALGLELAVKIKENELEPMDAETKAWLEADLAPPLEADAHGELDPMTVGRPVRYEPGLGLVVLESGE